MSYSNERNLPAVIDLAEKRKDKSLLAPKTAWSRSKRALVLLGGVLLGPESERPFSRVSIEQLRREYPGLVKAPLQHPALKQIEPFGPGIHIDLRGVGVIKGGKED